MRSRASAPVPPTSGSTAITAAWATRRWSDGFPSRKSLPSHWTEGSFHLVKLPTGGARFLCYEFIRARMISAQERTIGEDSMRGFPAVSSLALAASLSLSAGAAPKYESWEGTWHLNKKETVYPKGVNVTD